MGAWGNRIRLLAVAAGYTAAFGLARRAIHFRLDSPWFVTLAMICFLGLAFVARPVVPIRMPGFAKGMREWELKGGLYRRLGVGRFGALLRGTPLRFLNRDVYLAGVRPSVAKLTTELEAAEASHFWAALLVIPYMALLCLRAAWPQLLWMTVAQVLINVYPIMHLRLTRHRLALLALKRGSSGRLRRRDGGGR